MKLLAITLSFALAACTARDAIGPAARPAASLRVPDVTLTSTSGDVATYPRDLTAAKLTVFIFFSRDCLCFTAHQPRLHALEDRFTPLGVRFVLVDPETSRTAALDAREVQKRSLPGPIFLDPGAKLATALGAEFATYAAIVDGEGHVRYRGGIDSDKSHLREDSTAYLANALDDLTAGREPRVAEAKTLGCVLQTW
jgi:hypothetical protein